MQTRIYHPSPLKSHDEVTLTAQASNHCTKVLRLKPGQTIELFCGDGSVYPAEILSTGKSTCVKTMEAIQTNNESPLNLHLGQGLARHDRMDWIIQKAVECGVQSITPLISDKSIVKFKPDRLDHKMNHWQQIIVSACEQSGRTHLPLLHTPQKLNHWVEQPFAGHSIVFHPTAQDPIHPLSPSPTTVRVLLGPESGLSDTEIQLAQRHHFSMHHLGPRILRTETATIVALACLQSHFGDF